MPVISITSDWNSRDFHGGQLHGALLRAVPGADVVCLSRDALPFEVEAAAYILRASWQSFPEGSIHLAAVLTASSKQPRQVCIAHGGHYFIGPDNGLFSLVFDEGPDAIVLPELNDLYLGSFPELALYPELCKRILAEDGVTKLGPTVGQLQTITPVAPLYDRNMIEGSVIYIDSYGNAVSNITKRRFEKTAKGREFQVFVQSYHSDYAIDRLSAHYGQVEEGELLALFNYAGYLEVALNMGSVTELLNLKPLSSSIRIKFDG
jgi:hypothetical protein